MLRVSLPTTTAACLASLCLAADAFAANAQLFNLSCSGSETVTVGTKIEENEGPRLACWQSYLKLNPPGSGRFSAEGYSAATEECNKLYPIMSYDTQWSKFKRVYRVNISQMRWCEGNCYAVYEIKEVSRNYLTLRWGMEKIFMNRETGQYIRTYEKFSESYKINGIGVCHKSPFSGMPPRKF